MTIGFCDRLYVSICLGCIWNNVIGCGVWCAALVYLKTRE